MAKRKGITVTYWLFGKKIKEYHKDASRVGCRFYNGEQYDVLFNTENEVVACFESSSVIGITIHD